MLTYQTVNPLSSQNFLDTLLENFTARCARGAEVAEKTKKNLCVSAVKKSSAWPITPWYQP
jgi:hypothetical protein